MRIGSFDRSRLYLIFMTSGINRFDMKVKRFRRGSNMASIRSAHGSFSNLKKCHSTRSLPSASLLHLQDSFNFSHIYMDDPVHQKTQLCFIDKVQKRIIVLMKSLEPHFVKDLSDFQEELHIRSFQENEKIQQEVISVVSLLKNLRKDVIGAKLKDINIEQFEKQLVELENKIAGSKDMIENRMLQLHDEEHILESQISSVANKIDEWSKHEKVDKVLPSVLQTAVSFNSGCSFNESVNKFQQFLRDRGGHTGGWKDADHLLFIHLRKKYPNKQKLYRQVHEKLPDMSLEVIQQHDQWFAEFQDLKAKQKQAICEWRANRKNTLHGTVNCTDNSKSSYTLSKELQRLQLYDVTGKREEQRQQIEHWKSMKEQEMELKARRQKEEQQKCLMQEEARRARQAMLKAEVQQYKERKLKTQLAAILQKEVLAQTQAKERASTANKNLKNFRLRDTEILARQKELRERTIQEKKVQQKVLEALRGKVRIQVARDPHRLLRPTGAWIEHTKIIRNMNASSVRPTVPLNVQEVPHLGIPAWRRDHK